jgi:hypothetical protein
LFNLTTSRPYVVKKPVNVTTSRPYVVKKPVNVTTSRPYVVKKPVKVKETLCTEWRYDVMEVYRHVFLTLAPDWLHVTASRFTITEKSCAFKRSRNK